MKRSDLLRAAGGVLLAGGAAVVGLQLSTGGEESAPPFATTPPQSCDSLTMRIQFTRSGGFAGMTFTTSVDTDTLSTEERKEVCQLVEDADFFDLPDELTANSTGADRYSYEVAIEDEGRSHSVSIGEASAPESLRPLLDWLNGAARRGP